jgi:hypothetical protein
MSLRSRLLIVFVISFVVNAAVESDAASPTVDVALKLTPVQQGVEYDTPSADELAKCSINHDQAIKAWVVRGPKNEILRQFTDSNGDNVVDIWSYYRDGLEVYRDVDSNNNGKADQYRWFHSSGTRWAIDENEDNTVDTWKMISVEEVAEEVVNALATNDVTRFKRLLLNADDIKKLGLDAVRVEQLEKRVAGATGKFETAAGDEAVKAGIKFSDFGGTKPGMVPAGSQGVTKDLLVYESVWAMVQSGEEPKQMQLGTLIRVGGSWKLIDGPVLGTPDDVTAAFFFDPGGRGPGERATIDTASAPTERMQETLDKLQKLDEELVAAAPADKPALHKQRAEYLLDLANSMNDAKEREQWLKQLADSVSAAAQEGTFPAGVAYLRSLEQQLGEKGEDKELLAYFEFHRMTAEYYGVTLADPKVDVAKAQEQWMKDLEAFVTAHPGSEHGAEAMRAIAMGTEMAGQTETALKWYQRILDEHPDNVAAKLAKGAITRLNSEGREIALQATDLTGQAIDLKSLRGKAVVVQYWTTTSDVSVADHAVLKELISKYGGKGLEVISINLDFDPKAVQGYLSTNRLPWRHVHDEGGFDGRLASEMGVVTVPLNVLVGPDGKVISSNIQAAEIEGEVRKLQVAGLPAASAR